MTDDPSSLCIGPPGKDPVVAWQQTPLGARLVAEERQLLRSLVAGLFGYHLLQIGPLGEDLNYLSECPVRHHIFLSQRDDMPISPSLLADDRLPIATDTLDAVLLPHTLDFSPDPQRLLREVERVLIPEGRLLILGFNPWSLWGLWRLVLQRRRQVPWCGNFIGFPRLHDWLSLLGFAVERTDILMFRPPLCHTGSMQRLEFMERLGRRYLPRIAGVYAVQAVKRVVPGTLVRPNWRQRIPLLGSRAAEPSTRGVNRDGQG